MFVVKGSAPTPSIEFELVRNEDGDINLLANGITIGYVSQSEGTFNTLFVYGSGRAKLPGLNLDTNGFLVCK
jgi:hypothetical protein